MHSFSIWHWIIVLFWAAIVGVPFWHIVKKSGHPAPLALLIFVPLVNLIFLWWFAFSRWPVRTAPGA